MPTGNEGQEIILDNGMTYEKMGSELMDSTVVSCGKDSDLLEDHKQYMTLLDFSEAQLFNPEQKYSSRLPNGGLSKVDEVGIKKQRSFEFGPKKGMSQTEYGEKFSMSYYLSEWTKKNKLLKTAPDGVLAEMVGVTEQIKDLMQGYDITYAEELVKTLTKGFDITTTEGPGSACARDGFPLFYEAHQLKDGATFSNIVEGEVDYTNVEDGKVKLQDAINKLKNMKFDNGKKIKQPKGEAYKLFCSRLRETYWLEVINNGNEKSGLGYNAAKLNTFSFQNNLVQVVCIDLLGDLDVDGNVIGSDDMWFISNPAAIKRLQAFKHAALYKARIKTWENEETDEINTSIRAVIGTGHYDAEFGIVGCRGAVVTESESGEV